MWPRGNTTARLPKRERFSKRRSAKSLSVKVRSDINKLVNQAKDPYNIHTDKNTDRRVCDLINGLSEIVESIGRMRNTQSDAHGVGATRANIENYHARLAVNAAANVADFMLSVADRAERRQDMRRS